MSERGSSMGEYFKAAEDSISEAKAKEDAQKEARSQGYLDEMEDNRNKEIALHKKERETGQTTVASDIAHDKSTMRAAELMKDEGARDQLRESAEKMERVRNEIMIAREKIKERGTGEWYTGFSTILKCLASPSCDNGLFETLPEDIKDNITLEYSEFIDYYIKSHQERGDGSMENLMQHKSTIEKFDHLRYIAERIDNYLHSISGHH